MIADEKLKAKYNFAFLDEGTKKEIRRKTLKAVCIPGYQVPYSSPELPIARGWGTGGLHLTLSLIGRDDVLKIIDQGSDASVNACNLRKFIHLTTDCRTTFDTAEATIIQSRHRVPEEILTENQILVLQVPQPEILRGVERHEFKTRQMHAEADYAKMWVSLYEAYVQFGSLMRGAGYPVRAHSRYLMTPSPIPKWDVPRLNHDRGLMLFGTGREKRIHCIPPHTLVEPLEFEDVKFRTEEFSEPCSVTGMKNAFLDEIYDSDGNRTYIINDSNYLDKVKAGLSPERRLFQNPEVVAK
jgi:alpha-D-ribose 1-methylphosphonate 5-phosphate C-P lyase